MNYLNAIEPRNDFITVGKTVYSLQRRCLKDHYALRRIAKKMQSEKAAERLEGFFEYIKTAAPNINIDSIPLYTLTELLNKLIELNNGVELLPWQKTENVKHIKTTNADYEARDLAMVVHLLAESYGWTEEYILGLQPEAAFCYVQEILLSDWRKDEYQWKLSQVGYDKDGRLRDFPAPEWYIETIGPSEQQARAKVPAKFMPDGVIIEPPKKGN